MEVSKSAVARHEVSRGRALAGLDAGERWKDEYQMRDSPTLSQGRERMGHPAFHSERAFLPAKNLSPPAASRRRFFASLRITLGDAHIEMKLAHRVNPLCSSFATHTLDC